MDLVKQARLASGMTQKQICDRLGKPKNYLIKVEGGERRLDVVELFAICDAMGADPKALIGQFAAQHERRSR